MKTKSSISVAAIIVSVLSSTTALAETTSQNSREMERLMVIGNKDNINNIAGSAQYLDLKELERYN